MKRNFIESMQRNLIKMMSDRCEMYRETLKVNKVKGFYDDTKDFVLDDIRQRTMNEHSLKGNKIYTKTYQKQV